jgi:hypothetical protein
MVYYKFLNFMVKIKKFLKLQEEVNFFLVLFCFVFLFLKERIVVVVDIFLIHTYTYISSSIFF